MSSEREHTGDAFDCSLCAPIASHLHSDLTEKYLDTCSNCRDSNTDPTGHIYDSNFEEKVGKPLLREQRETAYS